MKQTYRAQKGFTLIELMIVVAIIGILAAIALPAYLDYTARAQASEGLSATGGLRVDMSEYWALNNAWPTEAQIVAEGTDLGDIESAEYISEVTVGADGVITVEWDTDAGGLEGSMTIGPRTAADGPQSGWVCAAVGDMQANHVPSGCR